MEPKDELKALIAKGLTFSDCVQAFGVDRHSDPVARAAHLRFSEEGVVEFDDIVVVSKSGEAGAYVMGWHWVSTADVEKDEALMGPPLSVPEIEAQVVKKLISKCLTRGFSISVGNGESGDFVLSKSRDEDAIFGALMACEEDFLWIHNGDSLFGTVTLVYGNDGDDVIADYSPSLEGFLDSIFVYAERLKSRT